MSSLPAGQDQAAQGQTGFDRMAHLVIVALLCAISAAVIVTAWGFPAPMPGSSDVGAARFPLIYAVALLGLTGILLAQTLAKPVVAAVAPAEKPHYARVAIGMLLMLLMLLAIGYVGYFPSAFVLLMALMFLMGQRSPVWNPVIALAITTIIYFLFDYALNVPLPAGSLFE
ncbi:tripartite tricarboxylate transporter TctB family protein [Roseomonas sp. ACRSG]|nr:tripartite tricarboxylate transporter TctB family protein [Roseomonas sp. ACRSG]